MIDELYRIVQVVMNKNQRGKISPSEFNHAANQSVNNVQYELFSSFRKLNHRKSRFQDTPNYGNEAFNIKQAQEYYITEGDVSLIDGKANMPSDIYFINSVFDEKNEFEKHDFVDFKRMIRNTDYSPTSCMPIYTLNGNEMVTAPKAEKVEVTYFRKAKPPKWTYVIDNDTEMFNPDAQDFQDLDIHPSVFPFVFTEVLGLLGVNLREELVYQYVQQLKQEEQINKQ